MFQFNAITQGNVENASRKTRGPIGNLSRLDLYLIFGLISKNKRHRLRFSRQLNVGLFNIWICPAHVNQPLFCLYLIPVKFTTTQLLSDPTTPIPVFGPACA